MSFHKPSFQFHLFLIFALLFNLIVAAMPQPAQAKAPAVVTTPNPILFVTQIPIREDFATIGSVFGNQTAEMECVGRGGDLWIRYANGTLKNLTKTAGFGSTGANGFQDRNAIAVRDPSVYWDGTKALFSMVIGAPEASDTGQVFFWQMYEITGLAQNQTPVITKVPNQPANFNNVSPIYGTDDRIIFTSDRPRDGSAHLYPQRDEYEDVPTVSGLWSLNPTTGDLFLMNHAPSGDFTPIIDSFGRVIFTQWDHLERDSRADSDKFAGGTNNTFNWSNESASATMLNSRAELYPEPRATQEVAPNVNPHQFNQFFPWQIHEDGTQAETINHVGRQEISHNFLPSFKDDPNLEEFYSETTGRNYLFNFLQIKESPTTPGKYYGVDALRLRTHASGQIISMMGQPTLNADSMSITYVTHRDTSDFSTPATNDPGHYRDPLPLSDGTLIAAYTTQHDKEAETGTASIYDFRLMTVTLSGNGYYKANTALTTGIAKTVSYWDRQYWMTYSGNLWELQPVEVVARTRPARLTTPLDTPEQQVFAQAGVDVTQFQAYMKQNNLALIVGHNLTTRDDADHQQPYNLRIPGGVQTLGAGGTIYDVKFLQLFQADQLRSFFAGSPPAVKPGRRILAQYMHDPTALLLNPTISTSPAGSVVLGTDGSMAAFVPARRAVTFQLTNPTGGSVVRERYWLTFQPGEIRVCASCHGVNQLDQAGHAPPTNQSQALASLLKRWKGVLNPAAPLTLQSVASADGWILESGESTGMGGSMNSTATTFRLGDDAANKQYRSILHFNTSTLPDTAVIISATLKIQKQGQTGASPFNTHGKLLVDLRKNFFGSAAMLAMTDFQASATKTAAGIIGATPSNGWYSAALGSNMFPYINLIGTTQVRLRFSVDDNNDNGADYLLFYSGNATNTSIRPQLVIKYYVP